MTCLSSNGIFDLDCILPKDPMNGLILDEYKLSLEGVNHLKDLVGLRFKNIKNNDMFEIPVYINKNKTLKSFSYGQGNLMSYKERLWKYILQAKSRKLTSVVIDISIDLHQGEGHSNSVIVFMLPNDHFLSIRFEPHRHSTVYCRDTVRKYLRELFRRDDSTKYLYLDNVLIPQQGGIQKSENYQISYENMTNERVPVQLVRSPNETTNISPLKGISGFCSSWSAYAMFVLTCNKAIGLKEISDYLLHFGVDAKNTSKSIYVKHCKLYQFLLYNAYTYLYPNFPTSIKKDSINSINFPVFSESDKAKLVQIFSIIHSEISAIDVKLNSRDQLNLGGLTVDDLLRFDPHQCTDKLTDYDESIKGCQNNEKDEVLKTCNPENITSQQSETYLWHESVPDGTYIYRLSSDKKSAALSVRFSDKVVHFRILDFGTPNMHVEGSLSNFKYITDLIDNYKSKEFIRKGNGTYLTNPYVINRVDVAYGGRKKIRRKSLKNKSKNVRKKKKSIRRQRV